MGRGGMRWGAGRPGWHAKAEHCRSIDARRWAREGLLQSGYHGGWAWSDPETGDRLASIGYSVDADAVTLIYSMGTIPMRQHVPLLATECNFGGCRRWFGCPQCGRRVAVLYLRQRGFACRRCNRVAYASQSGDEIDRTWRRQSKLERRLSEHWRRPKGMHSSTYDRIIQSIVECEERRNAAFVVAAQRLGLIL
jgi:endogenous inhibitor of DNA gyrase (YacG/DUF329 family)